VYGHCTVVGGGIATCYAVLRSLGRTVELSRLIFPGQRGRTVRDFWRSTHDLARPMHVGRRATAIPEIDFFAFHVDWRALSAASKAHGARALHLESALCSNVRLPNLVLIGLFFIEGGNRHTDF